MKRIIIGMLIFIAGAFALVYGVGASLPQQHVAIVRAELSATPEEVFATVSNFRGHAEWRPSVERVEPLPDRDGKPAWVEIGASGPLPMELTESEPPDRLVTTILSEGLPFGGRWIFDVEPAAAGAIVTITEEGEVYSAIFRFVSRYVMGHHASASAFLTDLGASFGDTVTVEIVR